MGGAGLRTAVFLQVRLDSFRLPGKALLSLSGQTVIEHAMESLSEVKADTYQLLTDESSAAELSKYTEKFGFGVFAGPRDDVLRRYALAVREFDVDRIVRATGDNPLVSSELVNSILRLHDEAEADFSGFLGPPLGTCVEILNRESLLDADNKAADPYEREHVSPYLYRREDKYKIFRPQAPDPYVFPESRVTLDTKEDYIFLTRIFSELYNNKPVKTDDLVVWLKENTGLNSIFKEKETENIAGAVGKKR